MTPAKAHIFRPLFAEDVLTKTESAQIIDARFDLMNQEGV